MTAAGQPLPDLTHERAQVLALIAGSPMSRSGPAVQAASALRSLEPALEAKLAASPAITASRTPDVRQRVVVPSAALAALDAVALVVAAVTGHLVLAVLAAVLLVPLGALAFFGARFARDPMRLTAADRRAIAAASRWQSRQNWDGSVTQVQERGLVIAAARTAERIAGSPAWRSGWLDDQRVRLDLEAELDEIDAQAFRIAAARAGTGGIGSGAGTAADTAWQSAVDRVAALVAYANELDGYARRRRDELARQGEPVRDSDLLAGLTKDEFAVDQLLALTLYLTANQAGDWS